jgi:archaellin
LGDSDAILESGEKMHIEVNVSQLSTKLDADVTFTIEVKPDRGSVLLVERTTPAVIDNVRYTN